MKHRCAIAVMAKAPEPGRCKTRLCPPLAPEEAAALSAAFVFDMTASIARAARGMPIDGYVAFAPAGAAALIEPHIAPGTGLLLADGAIDAPAGVAGFGRPLVQTISILLARGYGSVCVLNSDSPTLPAAYLAEAARLLADGGDDRAVFGPATDGGYYLLGVTAAHAALFTDIHWSTERVAEQTRAQAAQLGLRWSELPPWHDVDDAASLRHLLSELAHAGEDRPVRTADVVERLGLRPRLAEAA